MLAEGYATIDKEKRENVDLKNNAEGLCYEANKQLLLVKETISEEKQNKITELIEAVQSTSNSDDFEGLKSKIEELKVSMQEILPSNPVQETN